MRRASFSGLVAQAEAVKAQMPVNGISAAAFEAMALGNVAPQNVGSALNYLHNRGVIFLRRNRGDVRVFAERPASIAGLFDEPDAIDRLLSSGAIHMRRIASNLAARDVAKRKGDTTGANEARDRLAATAARLVAMVRKRVKIGGQLDAIRRDMWATYSGEVMRFVAGFEPALGLDATSDLARPRPDIRRITNGLDNSEKVMALVAKAGERGLTKSDLLQAIRPKPSAERLGAILNAVTCAGELEARQVRVRGTRFVTRYFAAPNGAVNAF